MEKLLREKEQISVQVRRASAAVSVTQQALDVVEEVREQAAESYALAAGAYQAVQRAGDAQKRMWNQLCWGGVTVVGCVMLLYLAVIQHNAASRPLFLGLLFICALSGLRSAHSVAQLRKQPRNVNALQREFERLDAQYQRVQARWQKRAGEHQKLSETYRSDQADLAYWQRELVRVRLALQAQAQTEQRAVQRAQPLPAQQQAQQPQPNQTQAQNHRQPPRSS